MSDDTSSPPGAGEDLPPEDPDAWTDEQWIEWLERVEAKAAQEQLPELPRWRQRALGVQMLSASMFGLFEALYGPRDEPAIVIQVSGDPPGDDPIEPHLDPIRPASSTVVVRPWLLKGKDE